MHHALSVYFYTKARFDQDICLFVCAMIGHSGSFQPIISMLKVGFLVSLGCWLLSKQGLARQNSEHIHLLACATILIITATL